MPLIVEDGSGLANANGYADAATVRAYWEDRAQILAADTIEIEAAIVIASQFVDLTHQAHFIGRKKSDEQALQWPRVCAGPYPEDALPMPLVRAVCEYTKRQLDAPLQPDPGTAGEVIETTEKLEGVGELTTRYAEGTTRPAHMARYPLADKYLDPLIGVGRMNYLRR